MSFLFSLACWWQHACWWLNCSNVSEIFLFRKEETKEGAQASERAPASAIGYFLPEWHGNTNVRLTLMSSRHPVWNFTNLAVCYNVSFSQMIRKELVISALWYGLHLFRQNNLSIPKWESYNVCFHIHVLSSASKDHTPSVLPTPAHIKLYTDCQA